MSESLVLALLPTAPVASTNIPYAIKLYRLSIASQAADQSPNIDADGQHPRNMLREYDLDTAVCFKDSQKEPSLGNGHSPIFPAERSPALFHSRR